MTRDQLLEKAPSKCPKCGAFVERVLVADDNHLPGYHCNKAGCGWSSPLPGRLQPKCHHSQVISSSLRDMLRLAPLNEMIRAQVHSIMLKPVPKSCTTLETIVEWIEQEAPDHFTGMMPPPPGMPLAPRVPSFSHPVSYSYIERGRCRYSVERNGSDVYHVDSQALLDLVADSNDMDILTRRVRDYLIESAQENPPSTDSDEDTFSESERDCDDTDDDSYDVSTRNLRAELEEYLRVNHPDQYRELTGEE